MNHNVTGQYLRELGIENIIGEQGYVLFWRKHCRPFGFPSGQIEWVAFFAGRETNNGGPVYQITGECVAIVGYFSVYADPVVLDFRPIGPQWRPSSVEYFKTYVGPIECSRIFVSSLKRIVGFFQGLPLEKRHYGYGNRGKRSDYSLVVLAGFQEPKKYGYGPIKHTLPFWLGILLGLTGGVVALAGILDASWRPFVLGGAIFVLGMWLARGEIAPRKTANEERQPAKGDERVDQCVGCRQPLHVRLASPDSRPEDIRVRAVVVAELDSRAVARLGEPAT